MSALGFAFLKNIVAGKTKAYGKSRFWELLLSFKAQVGPVYVITSVGNMLILKLCSSGLLCTIKTSYLWLFQVNDDDDDDNIYCSDHHRPRHHLSELSSSSSPSRHIYIKSLIWIAIISVINLSPYLSCFKYRLFSNQL